eukprot:6088211-Pyramimonas_sp.AAC.1
MYKSASACRPVPAPAAKSPPRVCASCRELPERRQGQQATPRVSGAPSGFVAHRENRRTLRDRSSRTSAHVHEQGGFVAPGVVWSGEDAQGPQHQLQTARILGARLRVLHAGSGTQDVSSAGRGGVEGCRGGVEGVWRGSGTQDVSTMGERETPVYWGGFTSPGVGWSSEDAQGPRHRLQTANHGVQYIKR